MQIGEPERILAVEPLEIPMDEPQRQSWPDGTEPEPAPVPLPR